MNGQKLSTAALSLWSRDQGEPGGEGAAASGHDPPAVRPAGPAPDSALGAEEHGRDAPGEAAAADGARDYYNKVLPLKKIENHYLSLIFLI